MLARKVLDWHDKQMEKSYEEEGLKSYARAFVAGMAEGAIDGMIVTYFMLITAGIVTKVTKKK